jgi:hypothetical protein
VVRPALLTRRSIWLPTVWGWLVVFVLAFVLVGLMLGGVHEFLAEDDPGVGAEVLVVEGWLGPDELREAVPLMRSAGYRKVVTAGGPIRAWAERLGASTYAGLARQYLIEQGLNAHDVIAVASPDSAQNRTYLSAVMVREWALAQTPPPRRIDVLSSGVHSRRTRRMYQLAFGNSARVGIRSAQPSDYEVETWWQTSAGAKAVVVESISWLWSVLLFHPPAQGSEEELWSDPEAIRRWRAAKSRLPVPE